MSTQVICSALTYWEEYYPSRLDLGMEEEVQDVMTMLRFTPLLISLIGFSCGQELSWITSNAHTHDVYFLTNFKFN